MTEKAGKKTALRDWIDTRWPLSAVLRWGLNEKIPGGASFSYVLGSATLFLIVLQVVTGIWQLFYYVPSVDHAYDSVSYLRLQVPFGWLIHGLHYWGANAFIVVMGLHLTRVFIWGAYKKPRELTWLLGVALLAMGLGFIFTGALLPWDELGYWAGEVGTSIAGTVPIIGDFTLRLMRGGATMGQLTLSRFFVIHVALLPVIIVGLITVHIVAFRQFGSVGPWDPRKRERTGWFWPEQTFKDLLVVLVVLLVLIGLSAYWRAPFSGPADPLDNSFSPKPEWTFLFLYQALKVFKGAWEPVGTVGIPSVLFLLLVLLPFLDRSDTRNPAHRPFVMGSGIVLAAGILALTIVGYYSHPGAAAQVAASPAVKHEQAALPPGAKEGAQLFVSEGCIACHTINGRGGKVGPNLSAEGNKGRSQEWLVDQLENSKSHFPKSVMPPFSRLPQDQIHELVTYLMTLKSKSVAHKGTGDASLVSVALKVPASGKQGPPGPASSMIGNAEHGQVLFTHYCVACHGAEGKGGIPNPGSDDGTVPPLNKIDPELSNANPQIFAQNIGRFMQHGSRPDGPHPQLYMPDFGDSHTLTQQQIAQIQAYILKLNGVDRTKIVNPGVAPRRFFQLAVAVFAVVGLILAVLWLGRRKRWAQR